MIKNYILALIFTASMIVSYPVTAEPVGDKKHVNKSTAGKWRVESIKVEGNQRVELSTIQNYLTINKGDYFDRKLVDASLKKLFATGLFANVTIEPKGHSIIVKVIENPVINKIVFEGNKKLKAEDLEVQIALKPRMVFSKTLLQADINRLTEVYHRMGRYSVSITPKIIQLSQNRVNLVFEVDEGAKTPISKIFFIGNKHFTDNKLSSVVTTKESKWYRFFSSGDSYDSERLEFDKEKLKRFYWSSGYPDFKVISTTAELAPDRKSFIITFSVEEGEKYNFGNITIDNKLKNVNETQLRKQILTKKGEIYNHDEVEDTVEAVIKYLNNNGQAFVEVEPEEDHDRKDRVINIKYVIREGQKIYVNRIHIEGNVRTMDKVIRREMRLSEGDPSNPALINRSRQRLENLDYFEKVELNPTMIAPDRVDLDIKVEEKSTAKINFAAGFSTVDGMIGQISLTEDNFLGKGQQAGISVMRATKKLDGVISFTEPYFMDRDLAVGVDLFSQSSDKGKWYPFKSMSIGVSPKVGYELSEYLRHTVRYTLKKEKISDIANNASLFIKEQEGTTTVSAVGQNFVYDRTNSRINPTSGYLWRFDQDMAGLGAKARYLRNELNLRYYVPITRKHDVVLQLAGNGGYVHGLGRKVPINERYFIGDIGMYGLRGFAPGGIGPRVKADREPLGGNAFYTGTAQLSFPTGLPQEFDMTGHFFVDVGSAFGVDIKSKNLSKSDIWNDRSLRVSTGLGIAWVTRLGPIKLDFAYPIKRKKYDRTQHFHINFSTAF